MLTLSLYAYQVVCLTLAALQPGGGSTETPGSRTKTSTRRLAGCGPPPRTIGQLSPRPRSLTGTAAGAAAERDPPAQAWRSGAGAGGPGRSEAPGGGAAPSGAARRGRGGAAAGSRGWRVRWRQSTVFTPLEGCWGTSKETLWGPPAWRWNPASSGTASV